MWSLDKISLRVPTIKLRERFVILPLAQANQQSRPGVGKEALIKPSPQPLGGERTEFLIASIQVVPL